MSLFGKKNPSAANVSKSPSTIRVVGSLFNPNLGATLRPLGESGKMLVTIIAMVFAANGLFPRNHPALVGVSGARLSFAEVMRIGWSNVTFTRKTIPQTLIFFAVLLSLGCSVLAVLAGLMSIMTGTAHAQAIVAPQFGPAMFAPPAADSNDVACGWINWLFNTQTFGCDLQNYLQPNGQQVSNLQSNVVQNALVVTLGFYSDVILVIAAVVLFYHLTAMIVETAHHGVVMGRRANQVWAPIRLVVAVGLLVPIAAGLNSGQFIVLQIAQWGSAVASNAWTIFLEAFQQATQDQNNGLVPPLAPIVRQEVADLILMEACATAYNQIETAVYGGNNNNNANPPLQINVPNGTEQDLHDGTKKFSFTPQAQGQQNQEAQDTDLCGFYIEQAPILAGGADPAAPIEQRLGQAIQQDGFAAFTTTLPNIVQFANTNVEFFIEKQYNGQYNQGLVPNNNFETVINGLYGQLQQNLAGVQNYLAQAMAAVVATAQQEGWVAAGAWFNTIARIQGDVTDLAHDFPVKTTPPQVGAIVKNNAGISANSVDKKLAVVMGRFSQWLNQEVNPNINGNGNLTAEQQQIELAQAGIISQNSGADKTHVMDEIFAAVDYIAARDGVWQPAVTSCQNGNAAGASCFSLGVQFTTANPLAEIAAFGHSNLNTAYDVFDDYLVLMSLVNISGDAAQLAKVAEFEGTGRFSLTSIFAKVFGASATATKEAGSAIGDVIGMVVVVFFTGGFMLAFFLPLIPFYRFMFGTLSWFLSLLEAVIAMPLVALAHLTPEGEGFMGDKAKAAYYFVFNLFLRPTLMIFGLATGFLLFCIAASLMNLLYTTAVAAAGGIGNGHYTLARIVYSIIYIVILYLCCNKCFQLIDWLPEHAIKWMGAQGLHHAPMGNPEEIGGYMGLASGYVEQKIVAGTGQLMKSAGGPIGGALAASKQYGPAMSAAGGRLGAAIGGEAGAAKGQELVTGAANKIKQAEQLVKGGTMTRAAAFRDQGLMPKLPTGQPPGTTDPDASE